MSRPRRTPDGVLPETFAQNERDLAVAWLKYSIEKFRANIKRLKIGSTQELYNSLKGELLSSAGADELKIRLSYAVHGMFVDMGVGRGMAAGVTKAHGAEYRRRRNAQGRLHRHERRAKRWFSKQMGRETKRLSELASELWGQVMLASVEAAVPAETTTLTF